MSEHDEHGDMGLLENLQIFIALVAAGHGIAASSAYFIFDDYELSIYLLLFSINGLLWLIATKR